MAALTYIRQYLSIKNDLCRYLREHRNLLQEYRREYSDGFARFLTIAQREWSYIAEEKGWSFSSAESGVRVFIHRDDLATQTAPSLNAQEFCTYMRCLPEHSHINHLVVDMWLTNACIQGAITSQETRPGYYCLFT